MDPTPHLDVLIVGAGISGIAAGYHLQTKCPGKTYAILEARERLGGTWDLFRYPGIRSDSDMYTLGLLVPPLDEPEGHRRRPVHPGVRPRDGRGVRHRPEDPLRPCSVERARWSSDAARWTVEARDVAVRARRCELTCGFLFMCAGYYDYDAGYTPELAGHGAVPRPHRAPAEVARGHRLRGQARRRHRQRRDGGDAGAGAREARRARDDAPALADVHRLRAGAATRSPTGCASACPIESAYAITRWKNVLFGMALLRVLPALPGAREEAPRRPGAEAGAAASVDVDAHFTPVVQAVGPAPLPRARRGPLQGHPGGARVGRDRSHRDVHRDGHPAAVGRGARGGPRRHGDGAQAQVPGRARARGRRQARSSRRRRWPTRA